MTRRLLAIGALSIAACTASETQPPAVDTAADEQAIRELLAQEVAAINNGNAAGYIGIIAPDFEAMPPNEPALTGADAVTNWLTNFFNAYTAQAQYTNEQISVHGDVAIHRYSMELTMTPKAGGAAMTEKGKGLHVFQRQADGTWKLTHDVWNSDIPPAAPPTAPAK
jgi:uncharacterized protein (TIGR02246 family)